MEKAFNDKEDQWFNFNDTVFDKYMKDVDNGKAKLYKDMPKGTAESFRRQMCIDNRKIDRLPQLKQYYENKLAQALIKQNDSLNRIKVCNYKLSLINKYLNKPKLTYKDTYKIDAITGIDTPEKSRLTPIINDELVIGWIKERLYNSKNEKFTKMLEDTLNEYSTLCNMR